jgi:tripartite-type tricarboxylate transporter receptor subunit TctC
MARWLRTLGRSGQVGRVHAKMAKDFGTHCRSLSSHALAAAALLLPALCGPAVAQPADSFYKGREMKFVLSANASGGYGAYARILQTYLEKHIPGRPHIVQQSMIGAGGIVAANWLANVAPKDGSVIAMIHRGAVSTIPLFGAPNIHFDATKFGWIGSMNADISVCVVWHEAGVKSFADLQSKPSIFGGIGPGSDIDMMPNLLNNLFDTKIQLITGYDSSNAIHVAMERREVDGRCGFSVGSLLATKADWLRDKLVNVVVQIGLQKHPAFPDVPVLSDLTQDPELLQVIETIVSPLQIMGRPILTAPGVPPERLAVLRRAFAEAMADPDFKADADRERLEYEFVSGEQVEAVIHKIYSMPKPIIARAAQAVQRTDKLKITEKKPVKPPK